MKVQVGLLITLLFVCWSGVVIGHGYSRRPSGRLLRHAILINGLFIRGDPADSQNPSAIDDLSLLSLRPIDIEPLIPTTEPGFTYYLRVRIGSFLEAQQFVRITETTDGTKTEAFSFSDTTSFVPGQFDIANLTSATASDIGELRCTVFYKEDRYAKFVEVSKSSSCPGSGDFFDTWTCRALINTRFDGTSRTVRPVYRGRYPLSPSLEAATQNFRFPCRRRH